MQPYSITPRRTLKDIFILSFLLVLIEFSTAAGAYLNIFLLHQILTSVKTIMVVVTKDVWIHLAAIGVIVLKDICTTNLQINAMVRIKN